MSPYRLAGLIIALCCALSTTARAQIQLEVAFPNLPEIFSAPVDIAYPDDGSNRLFIVELSGVIVVLPNDPETGSRHWFLDIRERVETGGEAGLLGLAFHPDYVENGRFYVFYTASDPLRSVLAQYEVDPNDPGVALPESEEIILELEQPTKAHNAGQIRFGPDGYLYVSLGDGGEQHDPHGVAQDPSNLYGTILRIDVDQTTDGKPYAIPSDNPFVDSTGFRPEIYAYGFRNPWRFSFDGKNIWTGDVGYVSREEIDVVEKGGNYGWNVMEGTVCHDGSDDCDTSDFTPPIYDYDREQGRAIIGGAVYRGESLPGLSGRYIYGDYVSRRIWALEFDGDQAVDNTLIAETDLKQTFAFGTDQNGEMYVLGISEDEAESSNVFRVIRAPVNPAAESDEIPFAAAELGRSYPNPFRGTTSIAFTVAQIGKVSLRVYDIRGRHVDTLVDEVLAPGMYEERWIADGLPSGLYVYDLRVNERSVDSGRVTLVQ